MVFLHTISHKKYVYPLENSISRLFLFISVFYVSALFSSYKPLKFGFFSYTAVFLCGASFTKINLTIDITKCHGYETLLNKNVGKKESNTNFFVVTFNGLEQMNQKLTTLNESFTANYVFSDYVFSLLTSESNIRFRLLKQWFIHGIKDSLFSSL